MSFTAFKLDKIVCATPTAAFIALRNAEVSPQIETWSEHPAGHPTALAGGILRVRPMIRFTTPQLETLLGAFPVWGANPSATLYRKKAGTTAPLTRSDTVHDKITVAKSTTYWGSVTLPAFGQGTADVTMCAIYNGSVNPIVHTGSQALSGNLSAVSYFSAGPIQINGTDLNGIEEVTIQSGASFMGEGDAASVFDVYGEITNGPCIVTIKMKELTNFSTYGITGTALSSAGLVGFARKRANETTFVADGTAEHIKFQATQGTVYPVNSQSDEKGIWSDTLAIQCLSEDDSSPPIEFTTSSAIAF